ncbi:MAG: hypothetical protein HOP29_12625, partial [Phycisphaerales bacterium]|nr:hypothetical protein [Phycisphaerales bacterium]
MSKSKISLFCCIVGAAATVATAQPRAFFVRANDLPSTNPAGRLQVNNVVPGVASSLCLDLAGSSPAPGLHKAIQLRIGHATGGDAGTVTLSCVSVAIVTASPTHPGNTLNVVNNTTLCTVAPFQGSYALSNLDGSNMTIAATGSYLGEACWNVSASACGTFAIDYQGNTCPNGGVAGCGTTLFIGAGVSTTVAITADGADLNLGPANDDCETAAVASDGANAYNGICATDDGNAGSCSALLADVWFTYTSSCTGELIFTGPDDFAVYSGAACDPLVGDEEGCALGGGNVTIPLQSDGTVYLVQIGSDDGSSIGADSLSITCNPACTVGPAAGSVLTNLECGPPTPPSDCHLWFCDAALGCVSVNAANGSACGAGGDGLTCTINDSCQSGVCTGGGALDCDDDAICTFDECVEPGGCVNTDINAVPCIDITDCPPGAATCSSDGDGTCDCVSSPDLCINAFGVGPAPASGECYDEGAQVVVTVEMGFSTEPICTAQFFLQYDNSCMDFVSITPGGGVFTNVVFQAVDEGAGTIDYAIGPPPGQICNGTQGPATI